MWLPRPGAFRCGLPPSPTGLTPCSTTTPPPAELGYDSRMCPPAKPTGWRRSSTPARASPTASTAWSPRCCHRETGLSLQGANVPRAWWLGRGNEAQGSSESDEFQDLHLLLEQNLDRILLEIQGERESVVVMLP